MTSSTHLSIYPGSLSPLLPYDHISLHSSIHCNVHSHISKGYHFLQVLPPLSDLFSNHHGSSPSNISSPFVHALSTFPFHTLSPILSSASGFSLEGLPSELYVIHKQHLVHLPHPELQLYYKPAPHPKTLDLPPSTTTSKCRLSNHGDILHLRWGPTSIGNYTPCFLSTHNVYIAFSNFPFIKYIHNPFQKASLSTSSYASRPINVT